MGRHRREVTLVLVIAALAILLAAIAPGYFAAGNLGDLFLANMPVLVVAIGMTLVILTGNIDISVGSVFAICSVVAGVVAKGSGSVVAVFTGMTLLASLSALPAYVFAAGAEMLLAVRARQSGGAESTGPAIAIGLAAFAYGILTVLGAGDEYVARCFLLLIVGMPFYVLARARRRD